MRTFSLQEILLITQYKVCSEFGIAIPSGVTVSNSHRIREERVSAMDKHIQRLDPQFSLVWSMKGRHRFRQHLRIFYAQIGQTMISFLRGINRMIRIGMVL
jgi:hypothetical protein